LRCPAADGDDHRAIPSRQTSHRCSDEKPRSSRGATNRERSLKTESGGEALVAMVHATNFWDAKYRSDFALTRPAKSLSCSRKQGAYSMLFGRFVFCVVSIAFVPSLVMPAKSLAADKKVDCGKILTEIESGKSAQEVAKMMGISTSSVYRCEKKATTSIPSASNSRIAIPTPSVRAH
jgi:hypothetical protein